METRPLPSEEHVLFRDRVDAGRRLVGCFAGRELLNPLILAVPRGGVPVGEVLAGALDAELDVVIVRKLRSPYQPELALGAISEGGTLYLNADALEEYEQGEIEEYLEKEKQYQLGEISRRQKLLRRVRPRAPICGRSVVVVDDGVATGATIIAALQILRPEQPAELVVAVPVGSPDRLAAVQRYCDEVVCPCPSDSFSAVGQFYEDFSAVEDEEVVAILARTYQAKEASSHGSSKAGSRR